MSAAKKTAANRAKKNGKLPKGRKYRIAAAAAMVLVLVLALLLSGGTSARRYERYRRQAAESYQKGDYDLALSDLRKAEALRPSAEVQMLMADCYEAQGNWDLALETLRKMDRDDASVAERIAALEQRRQQQPGEGWRIIAGESFPDTATELNLNGRGLGNGVLPEIAQLHALASLSLADNQISDLQPLSSLGGLRSLDLSGNAVSDLTPLEKLEDLRSLNLDGNPVRDFSPLYGMEELGSLSLRGVKLEKGALEALSDALPHCAILTDGRRDGVTNIHLSGVSFDTEATELKLDGLGLRDLSCLSLCTALTRLELGNNEIVDLSPLMSLQQLNDLKLSGNRISDLRPLIGLPALQHLEVARNSVTDTSAVGSITGLLSLDLADNPIGDFSGLKKLEKLQTLHLENTGAGDEALACLHGLSRLARLFLERNEGISAEAMAELESQLPDCRISCGTLVYTVRLGGEDFRTDITSLRIEGTELSDLFGLEQFENLETVELGRNWIENLSAFQNAYCREKIRTLDLSFNRVRDLSPLASLTGLETLDLRSNEISSLRPLMQMRQLKKLDLRGNPLTEDQVEELRRALPDCEILF